MVVHRKFYKGLFRNKGFLPRIRRMFISLLAVATTLAIITIGMRKYRIKLITITKDFKEIKSMAPLQRNLTYFQSAGTHGQDQNAKTILYDLSVDKALKDDTVQQIPCSIMHFDPPFPICHHGYLDGLSKIFRTGQLWEKPYVEVVKMILKSDPELGFLDIGANLGYYSMIAASLGHKVLAVEPLSMNIIRFHKAVNMTNFAKNITLLKAGISDERREAFIQVDPTNIGNSVVKYSCRITFCYKLKTILLDDLLEYITFKKAVLKLDIEGKEASAMRKSAKLFERLDMCYVFVETEWVLIYYCQDKAGRDYRQFRNMVKTFKNRNYTAYDVEFRKPINVDSTNCHVWPSNVLWIRFGCELPWLL